MDRYTTLAAASSLGKSFATTFDGIAADGTWTLEMQDNFPDEDGSLSNWRLILLTDDGSSFFVIPVANGKAVIIEL